MVKDRMIEKDHTDSLMDGMVIARLDSHGHRFEVIVKVDYVSDGREEVWKDIVDHMPASKIFSDAKKGESAPEKEMTEAFGTTEVPVVAAAIIKKGNIQLTTEQRREMQENKRRQIIDIIAKNAINPQSRTPHPPSRIENALNEANIHIDPFKSADAQVKDVLSALTPLLPIRFEKVDIAVHISGEDYGKLYGTLQTFGTITKEEWQDDGSWIGVINIPAGLQNDFFDAVNAKTKGDAEIKILEK
jgi:ribosome maturation protein SDO1